jgi:hypothetical protein
MAHGTVSIRLAFASTLLIAMLGHPLSRCSGQAPAAPPASNPFDVPLRYLAEAQQSYRGLRDYACLFVKQERLRGRLEPENIISMQVRTQPFSVYMRWLRPDDVSGQEALYVVGQNRGMLRVHSVGLRGAAGFVSLDPNDPRVLEHNRHPIVEAGIGNLIERLGQRWTAESRWNQTEVRTAEFRYDGKRCVRVELTHAANPSGQFPFRRSAVYFDLHTHLPIRIENYDWPKRGEDPRGVLAECYSYTSLRLNLGVHDGVFNR